MNINECHNCGNTDIVDNEGIPICYKCGETPRGVYGYGLYLTGWKLFVLTAVSTAVFICGVFKIVEIISGYFR